jgi:putative hydrolase of the HAD superfamily
MSEISFNGNRITTVIFDLDGTLRESQPGGDRFLLDEAIRLGVTCSEECLIATRQWAHRYWASSENLMMDEERYGRGEKAFWENYARRTLETLGASKDQVRELGPVLHQYMFEKYRPDDIIPEDVAPTLQKLKANGLSIGLLTNRTDSPAEYLEEIDLIAELDFYVSAGEIGSWKPAPESFYYSMGMAGSIPEETVYIGDNYYADVVGARAAGIHPVLIDRERIFPDPDCPVIYEIRELPGLLGV